jgi:uncharacterized protein YciI
MLFVVRFTDHQERLATRKQFLPAHLEWLEAHKKHVLVPGSLRPEPDAAPVGACWVVEAQDKKEVEDLLQSDPFWVQGLRKGYEIMHWFKAFPDRHVLV